MKKVKRRLIGFRSQMLIVYLNISKMKDISLTKTLLLQFLQKLNYLKNKIINLSMLKVLFYKTKNNLFKKLYNNQEILRFYNKENKNLF